MTPQQRYLNALRDPTSGITLETPPQLIVGTVQQQFADAVKTSDQIAKHMTASQSLALIRRNSIIGTRAYRERLKAGTDEESF